MATAMVLSWFAVLFEKGRVDGGDGSVGRLFYVVLFAVVIVQERVALNSNCAASGSQPLQPLPNQYRRRGSSSRCTSAVAQEQTAAARLKLQRSGSTYLPQEAMFTYDSRLTCCSTTLIS